MKTTKRMRLGIAALSVGAVATGVAVGVTHGRAQDPSSVRQLPSDVSNKLNFLGVNGVEVLSPPAGTVSLDSVEQAYHAGNGPDTITAAYLAELSDPNATVPWNCLCWLLIVSPLTPGVSEGGIPSTWDAMAYNANDGTFFKGWQGDFPDCAAQPCPGTVQTPPPIVPPN